MKEFISLVLKSQSHFNNKGGEKSGSFFSLKEQSTETKCAVQRMTSLLDSYYRAGFKDGFFVAFSVGSMWCVFA